MDHNVLAIASDPCNLDACLEMLSRFAKRPHYQVHLLLAPSNAAKKSKGTPALKKYKTHVISGFDYGEVSQNNVNALRSVIDELKPSLVIIPSFRILESKTTILASSALLASRPVGNIMMYSPSSRSKGFKPSIFLRDKSARKAKPNNRRTGFESHRIVLLDEVFH